MTSPNDLPEERIYSANYGPLIRVTHETGPIESHAGAWSGNERLSDMDKIVTNTEGTWFVWGNGTTPLAGDISREEAVEIVDRLRSEGRADAYAEDNETGETYEPDTTYARRPKS